MKQDIYMIGIIPQHLRAHLSHSLPGFFVRIPQHAREEGKGIRLDGFDKDGFAELADFFETSVFGPGSYGALKHILETSPKEKRKRKEEEREGKPYKHHQQHPQTPIPSSSPQYHPQHPTPSQTDSTHLSASSETPS